MKGCSMKKSNIVLIGMSGAGKSTVGIALSFKMRMPFVDMDNYIERTQKMTISKIFETRGNEYFRDIEAKAAKHIGLSYRHTIVSTGGGVILRPENMKYLKKNGVVVYINRSVENILKTERGKKAAFKKQSAKALRYV